MLNVLTRLNNLSATISSALFVLIGLITLSSLTGFNDKPNDSLIDITQLNVVNSYNKLNQLDFIRFDGDIDTTTLFDNWNTKQVFLQLSTSYINDDTQSTTVFWDKIITNKDNHNLSLSNIKQKYSLKSKSFAHYDNTTLSLTYDIQPYVGLNKRGTLYTQPIHFPDVKSNI